MLEIIFLIAIVALYSWYMGKRHATNTIATNQAKLAKKYVTGLNYLFSDQKDKAVDAFIELIDVKEDTIDTHLALASLFRKKGELERAIKLHQNLIARPNLTEQQRDLALFELAQDYEKVSFFDRAEVIYLELLESETLGSSSCHRLLKIYETTHDWQKALNISLEYLKSFKISKKVISHYYCELANIAKKTNKQQQNKYLLSALKIDKRSIRALNLLAREYTKQKKYTKAFALYEKITQIDIKYLNEIIDDIIFVYNKLLFKKNIIIYLKSLVTLGAGTPVLISLIDILFRKNRFEALEYLRLQLKTKPSLTALEYYLILESKEDIDPNSKNIINLLLELINLEKKKSKTYICNHCGYKSSILLWNCPACKNWQTINHN